MSTIEQANFWTSPIIFDEDVYLDYIGFIGVSITGMTIRIGLYDLNSQARLTQSADVTTISEGLTGVTLGDPFVKKGSYLAAIWGNIGSATIAGYRFAVPTYSTANEVSKSKRDFKFYSQRQENQYFYGDQRGVSYMASAKVPWVAGQSMPAAMPTLTYPLTSLPIINFRTR